MAAALFAQTVRDIATGRALTDTALVALGLDVAAVRAAVARY